MSSTPSFTHASQIKALADWPNRRKKQQEERIRKDYENAEKHRRHWMMMVGPSSSQPKSSFSNIGTFNRVGWPNRRKEEQEERILKDSEKRKHHWLKRLLSNLDKSSRTTLNGFVRWPNRRKQQQERIRKDYENAEKHQRHWMVNKEDEDTKLEEMVRSVFDEVLLLGRDNHEEEH
nr:unnamed protein product [Naegleria fowleri]